MKEVIFKKLRNINRKKINICTFIETKLFRYTFIASVFIWIGATLFIDLEKSIHLGMLLLMGSVTLLGYACKLNIQKNWIVAMALFIPVIVGIVVVFQEFIGI